MNRVLARLIGIKTTLVRPFNEVSAATTDAMLAACRHKASCKVYYKKNGLWAVSVAFENGYRVVYSSSEGGDKAIEVRHVSGNKASSVEELITGTKKTTLPYSEVLSHVAKLN